MSRKYQRKYNSIHMLDALISGIVIGVGVTIIVGSVATWVA